MTSVSFKNVPAQLVVSPGQENSNQANVATVVPIRRRLGEFRGVADGVCWPSANN